MEVVRRVGGGGLREVDCGGREETVDEADAGIHSGWNAGEGAAARGPILGPILRQRLCAVLSRGLVLSE